MKKLTLILLLGCGTPSTYGDTAPLVKKKLISSNVINNCMEDREEFLFFVMDHIYDAPILKESKLYPLFYNFIKNLYLERDKDMLDLCAQELELALENSIHNEEFIRHFLSSIYSYLFIMFHLNLK